MPASGAGIAPADLGQGLQFFRPVALTAEDKNSLVRAVAPPALVLDLRGATTDEPSTAALLAALRARTVGQGVCLILIAPDTAPGKCTCQPSHPVVPLCPGPRPAQIDHGWLVGLVLGPIDQWVVEETGIWCCRHPVRVPLGFLRTDRFPPITYGAAVFRFPRSVMATTIATAGTAAMMRLVW